jgi:hypothetical protein
LFDDNCDHTAVEDHSSELLGVENHSVQQAAFLKLTAYQLSELIPWQDGCMPVDFVLNKRKEKHYLVDGHK